MPAIDDITIDLSIVLGSASVPIRQILHMGRGATVALDCGHEDPTLVCVNGKPIAKGRILVNGDEMSLEITDVLKRTEA